MRVVRYDGCVNPECNQHTWHEKEKGDTCPLCGAKRFDEKVIYFKSLGNSISHNMFIFTNSHTFMMFFTGKTS